MYNNPEMYQVHLNYMYNKIGYILTRKEYGEKGYIKLDSCMIWREISYQRKHK